MADPKLTKLELSARNPERDVHCDAGNASAECRLPGLQAMLWFFCEKLTSRAPLWQLSLERGPAQDCAIRGRSGT
jgi:hypothetical protein